MAPSEILHYNNPGLSHFETPTTETLNPGESSSFVDSHGHEVTVTCLPDDSSTSVEHNIQVSSPRRDLLDLIFRTVQPALYMPPVNAILGNGGEFYCGEGPILSFVVRHQSQVETSLSSSKQQGVQTP